MSGSKVKLGHIENKSDRKTTSGKRSKCLLKKTSKLSKLCDVQACAILYGPESPAPIVWPSVEGAREALKRFSNMPENQRVVKKANQESCTNMKIKKQEEKLGNDRIQDYRNDMTHLLYKRMRGESTSKACLKDLLEMGSISNEKMREIAERIEEITLGEKCQDGKGIHEA